MRRRWKLVWFSAESTDPGYLNKRAQMWGLMRDWLKAGGAIPPDPGLHSDLIGPETVGRVDGKIQLESKADMKKRGLKSPNKADSLALSFAFPVKYKGQRPGKLEFAHSEYDPFKPPWGPQTAQDYRSPQPQSFTTNALDYDPFADDWKGSV
jgi:hypothetical protein